MERRTGIHENKLWQDIRQAAKNNPALHDAIERVKMIYYLSKKDGT
jgi:septation ring formation regulator EzrA